MKRITRILVFLTLLNIVFVLNAYADTINIPADYSTIQAGINAATNGDTVLVQPGPYVENINYNGKNITVGSLFLTTADTSYISQTIIDGNQSGSVVTFENGEDSTAVLCGFVITNGYDYNGGGIYIWNSTPIINSVTISGNNAEYNGGGVYSSWNSSSSLENVIISNNSTKRGGGLYCYHSSPNLETVCIINNTAIYYGGGVCCEDYSSPILNNVTIRNNSATASYGGGGGISCEYYCCPNMGNVTITGNSASDVGGGIYCRESSLSFQVANRCNIYSNTAENSRGYGADIFANTSFDVVVDTFTVFSPTDYYASPIENFTFDIIHSIEDSLINADVYVSVNGNNSNSGLTIDDAFKTIKHALSRIYSDSLNINTIYIGSGIYSDSTNGEIFPIEWSNYVNLFGSSEVETILDASQNTPVMAFSHVTVASIKNITIKNGYYPGYGGGIYCEFSDPSFRNVVICGNRALCGGGGIYCYNSSPSFESVTIIGNNSIFGSGIYNFYESYPSFINCIASYNTGHYCIYNDTSYPGDIFVAFSDFYNDNGNFYGVNDSIGMNIITNANGDSCDAFYNIQFDPLFVDPLNGDYHLCWANYPIPDSTKSPCIDAGDPTSPLDPDGTIADMGAYYFHQNVSVDDPQEVSSYMLTNYPNPISSHTNNLIVSFSIHKLCEVKIQLFNIKGQLVSTLFDDERNFGDHSISSTVDNLSSGIYFAKLSIDGVQKEVSKVVVLR